jgi:Zn-finger nucleic acid-binding protein
MSYFDAMTCPVCPEVVGHRERVKSTRPITQRCRGVTLNAGKLK